MRKQQTESRSALSDLIRLFLVGLVLQMLGACGLQRNMTPSLQELESAQGNYSSSNSANASSYNAGGGSSSGYSNSNYGSGSYYGSNQSSYSGNNSGY